MQDACPCVCMCNSLSVQAWQESGALAVLYAQSAASLHQGCLVWPGISGTGRIAIAGSALKVQVDADRWQTLGWARQWRQMACQQSPASRARLYLRHQSCCERGALLRRAMCTPLVSWPGIWSAWTAALRRWMMSKFTTRCGPRFGFSWYCFCRLHLFGRIEGKIMWCCHWEACLYRELIGRCCAWSWMCIGWGRDVLVLLWPIPALLMWQPWSTSWSPALLIVVCTLSCGEIRGCIHVFVLLGQVLENNWRPAFPKETPQQYRDIVCACWATEKRNRPTFHEVRVTLTKMLAEVCFLSPLLNVAVLAFFHALCGASLFYVVIVPLVQFVRDAHGIFYNVPNDFLMCPFWNR